MKMVSRIFQLVKLPCLLITLSIVSSVATQAQTISEEPKTQAISANPFGLMVEFFNAEYERVVSKTSTAGIGGSTFFGGDAYVNADVFWRFYPGANPLSGFTFGLKVGLTKWGSAGTSLGAGFDVNQSWLLGKKQNYYVGIGFGMKRMIVSSTDYDAILPTFRVINIGRVF